ncbi:hypothetical protein QU42_00250 [Bradyrhizobium sp. UASWS1016]|nr:hypothetical protein QU42_00250 [Bradyrhizobium sp. UASWS1016]OYU86123.1 MAG: hypothetical protein CFE29_30820 [Bradyrhizobiaceae bacterium PARB1]
MAGEIEDIFHGRADPLILGRAGVGAHRSIALLKYPRDGVAGASLIVDRVGGHFGGGVFGVGDLIDLDLQCKCITSSGMMMQGAGNGQDG